MNDAYGPRRTDWVQQLQDGTLPSGFDALEELRRLATESDPADSLAVFANVDVPEIDVAEDVDQPEAPAT